jgi:hypothetical protein
MKELAVGDGVVALRSFPRRFREALAGLDDRQLATRHDGPSIIEAATDAAGRLERYSAALGPTLDGTDPAFGDLEADSPSAAISGADADAVLRRVATAATAMADRADAAPAQAWERTMTSKGVEHPARWIVQRAVDEVAARLREIERIREGL